MKIDFTRPLFDFSGEVLRDGDKPLVLGVVAVNALMGIYPDEQNLDGREALRDTGLRRASTAPTALSTFLQRTSRCASS